MRRPKSYGDVTKFTVYRDEWRRGTGSSCLLLGDKMCCLGFYARACGVPRESIRRMPLPSDVAGWKTVLVEPDLPFSPRVDTDECSSIALANDDEDLGAREREQELRQQFADIGIEVVFKATRGSK